LAMLLEAKDFSSPFSFYRCNSDNLFYKKSSTFHAAFFIGICKYYDSAAFIFLSYSATLAVSFFTS
jgi:hypothetical protein